MDLSNLLYFVLGVALFCCIYSLGLYNGEKMKEKELRKNLLSLENVISCFKDVDWSINTFIGSSGYMYSDKNGETKFYSIKTIDIAIKKLNVLLNQA